MPANDWFHAAAQPWVNFYLLTGAAAATLAGLMFVAVTFGAGLVTKESANSARAFLDPIYRHFAQVLFTACLFTIPTVGPIALGGVLVAVGVGRLIGLRWVVHRYREAHKKHGDIEASDWVTGVVLPLLVYVALVASGVGMVAGCPASLTALGAAVVTLLFLAIFSAWELLVWMALTVSERTRD